MLSRWLLCRGARPCGERHAKAGSPGGDIEGAAGFFGQLLGCGQHRQQIIAYFSTPGAAKSIEFAIRLVVGQLGVEVGYAVERSAKAACAFSSESA